MLLWINSWKVLLVEEEEEEAVVVADLLHYTRRNHFVV
jgi:hypothetical protein